jgi:hypothetical protein
VRDNGRNEQVHTLDHATGKILSTFGRPGHQLGNFTHGHTLAVDSNGTCILPRPTGAGGYKSSGSSKVSKSSSRSAVQGLLFDTFDMQKQVRVASSGFLKA